MDHALEGTLVSAADTQQRLAKRDISVLDIPHLSFIIESAKSQLRCNSWSLEKVWRHSVHEWLTENHIVPPTLDKTLAATPPTGYKLIFHLDAIPFMEIPIAALNRIVSNSAGRLFGARFAMDQHKAPQLVFNYISASQAVVFLANDRGDSAVVCGTSTNGSTLEREDKFELQPDTTPPVDNKVSLTTLLGAVKSYATGGTWDDVLPGPPLAKRVKRDAEGTRLRHSGAEMSDSER